MAKTYYISTTGDDANDGSLEKPFASIAAISDALVKGDTVLYLSGTYQNATYGALNADGSRNIWKDSSDTIIRLNDVHGTKDAPITIKPAPGADVTLQYDGNGAIVLRNSSHINIEGFDIEGPATSVTVQDAQDAQWTYRIATSETDDGTPVYEYYERDPSEVLTTKISATIQTYADADIDQSGSGKPVMFNAPAISLPSGSHHIKIVDNVIHDSAAHAVSGHGGNDHILVSGNEIYNNNRHTSNGTHAVSFKSLNSVDDTDGFKVIIENNHFHDNYNALVSWVTTKTAVKMEIDEGKSIHIQNSMATVDAETGRKWDHGKILIANNVIERAGNAAVTLNDVRGATVVNNTIVDAGYINALLVQDGDKDSEWFGFFSQQGLPSGETASVGAIRLTGADGNVISDNLISLADATVFAVDAAEETNNKTTTANGNIYSGGRGLRLRSEADKPGDLTGGFTASDNLGFIDAAKGNYRLRTNSDAVNAGSATPLTTQDYDGSNRTAGAADAGAFEYLAPVVGYTRAQRPATIDTGDSILDAVITGLIMDSIYTTGTQITYAFNLSTSLRADDTYTALSDAAVARHLQMFADITSYTGVNFVKVDAAKQDANLYFANREGTGSAYVAGHQNGVLHVYNPDRNEPVPGGYSDHLMLHELGHGLGLGHGHDTDALPANFQGHSWSTMSYRGHPATKNLYFGDSHGPETFMAADLAALQFQFGANFATQAGDTTYSVNFSTGELMIDGVSQGVPVNAQMLRLIWDGNGVDTLDLSNATQGLSVDLRPGQFTSFGPGRVAYQGVDPDGNALYAEGNIANPFLYDGSTASLLENAIGGDHDDRMNGNQADNSLNGGAGNDVLLGHAGDDHLFGGAGDDQVIDGLGNNTITGDAGADSLISLSGRGKISGGDDSDYLVGGHQADVLRGGAGNDVLRGDAGSGFVFGSDIIDGGTGDDLLMGGNGADVFSFHTNDGDDVIAAFDQRAVTYDTITGYAGTATGADFQVGLDRVQLLGFAGVNAENILSFVNDGDDGAVFATGGTTIVFYDIAASAITADVFLFA